MEIALFTLFYGEKVMLNWLFSRFLVRKLFFKLKNFCTNSCTEKYYLNNSRDHTQFKSRILVMPFVCHFSCVYGWWCEHLRLSLGTIHKQNGLVSLYIHKTPNCLNDTSFSIVHKELVTQTHQHPTLSLLCQSFDGGSLKCVQHRNKVGEQKHTNGSCLCAQHLL